MLEYDAISECICAALAAVRIAAIELQVQQQLLQQCLKSELTY